MVPTIQHRLICELNLYNVLDEKLRALHKMPASWLCQYHTNGITVDNCSYMIVHVNVSMF